MRGHPHGGQEARRVCLPHPLSLNEYQSTLYGTSIKIKKNYNLGAKAFPLGGQGARRDTLHFNP